MGIKLRVMKGQKAAVCGLILAGVPMETACKVVAVSRRRMVPYIPADYRKYRVPLPVPILKMTQRQRYQYNILREMMPREKAFQEAMRP